MKRHKSGHDGIVADTKAEGHAKIEEDVETDMETYRFGGMNKWKYACMPKSSPPIQRSSIE